MGTKLESKRSIWALNESVSNDIWSLCRQDKTLKNGQNYASFLPQQLMMDGYLGYDKEKVKQMILDHESTFRHQLQELHRLYGRQRELMNEIKGRQEKKDYEKAETLHSSTFSSRLSSEDAKPKWHVSHTALLQSLVGRLSTSETSSLPSFRKGKSMPDPFSSRDEGSTEKCDPPSCKSNVLQTRMFDLEIPADVYMNFEGKKLEENVDAFTVIGSRSATSIHGIQHDKDVKSSFGSMLDNHHKDDGMWSNSCLKRKTELADLNESILQETTISAFTSEPAHRTCALNDIQKADASGNSTSSIHMMSKDISLYSVKERDGGTCLNHFQSRNERNIKEQLITDCESNACSKASQAELRKMDEISQSDQIKTENQLRRKLFGVDIFEVNDESLVTDTATGSCTHKLDSGSSAFGDKLNVNSRTRSISKSKEDVANKNDLSLCSQLDANQSQYSLIVGCHLANHMMDKYLLSKQKDNRMLFDGLECLNLNSAKVLKTATNTPSVFQDDGVLSAEIQNVQNTSEGLFLRCMKPEYRGEQTRENKNSYHLNLDSLQNSCQQFFWKTKTNTAPPQILTQKQETSSSHFVQETEGRNIASDKENTKERIYGFPFSNMLSSSEDPSFDGISSKAIYFISDGDNAGNLLVEKVTSKDQTKVNEFVLEERMNNSLSGLQHHFDLNLSLIEEEAPLAPCLPSSVLKIATTEIDLEAPVVLESEAGNETDVVSNLPADGTKDPNENLSRVAAEAIVAISLSAAQVTVNGATPGPLEAWPDDCLKWFAGVVSSCKSDDQSFASEATSSVNGAFTEELIPDGLDYFEFMTLKLEDTKEENYHYKPVILENQEDEETKATTLSRRPRRGQARRGRQRKDFQRDILPGLITLSKRDVTEDFQTFEELLRASGSTWQSSLVRKNAAKSSRGRKRSGINNSSVERNAGCAHPEPQPVIRELQVEEKTLAGWGKKTRRLPRQRCLNSSPACEL